MTSDDFDTLLLQVQADPRYQKNILYGKPRPGHPEGTVQAHIADLERNLALLRPRLRGEVDAARLRFLIHVHDTFKAEARHGAKAADPGGHAALARDFAARFTSDTDLLNMLQYHDENYALWKQYVAAGVFPTGRFERLLAAIEDWDLFLMFLIIDSCTPGKDPDKLRWFIEAVRQARPVLVTVDWILPDSV